MHTIPSPPLDARIARACIQPFPVTTRARLRVEGVHRGSITRRVRDGRMHELWTDAFAVGIEPDSLPRDAIRALALGSVAPDAGLAGASALERMDAWSRHRGTIEVASTRGHRPIDEHRIRFHRRAPEDMPALVVVSGLACCEPLDAVLHASRTLTEHQVANVIDHAEYRELWRAADLHEFIERRRGWRGAPTLRAAVALREAGSAGTRSSSEDILLPRLAARFGQPLVNVRGCTEIPNHEPDLCWPRLRLIVEVDGDQHLRDALRRRADAATDAALRTVGWTVVRIPWREARCPSAVTLVADALSDARG